MESERLSFHPGVLTLGLPESSGALPYLGERNPLQNRAGEGRAELLKPASPRLEVSRRLNLDDYPQSNKLSVTGGGQLCQALKRRALIQRLGSYFHKPVHISTELSTKNHGLSTGRVSSRISRDAIITPWLRSLRSGYWPGIRIINAHCPGAARVTRIGSGFRRSCSSKPRWRR